MKQSKDLQIEMNELRKMTDKDIDYSDIPDTDENCLATAKLEFVYGGENNIKNARDKERQARRQQIMSYTSPASIAI